MSEAKRQLAIKKRQLVAFRRYLAFNGTGDAVVSHLDMNVWDLRKHIEEQWQEGMDWENYGTFWVVDHVVPLKYFDLSKPKEAKLCWTYNNLKPTYYWDNHAKGYCVEVTVKELMAMPMTIMVRMLLEHIASKIEMFEIYY